MSTPTVVFFDFGNIGPTPLMITLLSDGSLWQTNTNTNIATQIAPPGTIINPNDRSIGVSQWGNQYIVIVASQSNGYFLWDGSHLFTAGTLGPDINLVNNGLDYTSQPTITANGGSGSGAAFGAFVTSGFVQTVSVTNPGGGYLITDAAVLKFTGGGSAGHTATGFGVVSSGTIASVSITDGGAGYTSTGVRGVFLGGGGALAAVSLTASGGAVTGGSISNVGVGYVTNPVLFVTDPNNPVAQASVDLMPFGIQGTTAETYQSRVWIPNSAQIEFTAPSSIVDFATSDGGGAFRSVDSFLRVGFSRLKQTNGLLYLIADSSINYISGVQTSGNPPTTTFTNQNADPEIGTIWPQSVQVFSRNILLANAIGVHVSYGGAVEKISDNLDGIYGTAPGFGNITPSSAKAIIYGKKVYILLLPVIDPITGQQVNKLFLWNRHAWFTSNQDVSLIYIASQEINSILTAYGTDGIAIYPLFKVPSVNFTKTVQSKLWDRPGSYMLEKAATRIWGLAYYYSPLASGLSISVDNETGQSKTPVMIGPNLVVIVNALGAVVVVLNVLNTVVVVLSSGIGIVVFPPTAVAQNGVLTGLTLQTNAADMALLSMTLQDEIVGYRG